MSSPFGHDAAACVTRAADVTFRALPEWKRALAYTPRRPQLTELNPTAWLIYELCDGRTVGELESEFIASTESHATPAQARGLLREGLQMLENAGLVECRYPRR